MVDPILVKVKIMACQNPQCMGNYNFEDIVYYAKKRFLEGYKTIDMMQAAKSEYEKEEIALVSLLDIEDNEIQNLQLCCNLNKLCKTIDCRDKLKKMIKAELVNKTLKVALI